MKLNPIHLDLNEIKKIIHLKKFKKLYLGGYVVTLTSLITIIFILFNLKNLIEYTYLTIACILMVSGIVYISKNKTPYQNKLKRAKKLQKILKCPEGASISSGNRLKISGIVENPINIIINKNQFLIGGSKEQIDLSIPEAKKFKKILEKI